MISHSNRRFPAFFLILPFLLGPLFPDAGRAQGPALASGQLEIRGSRLTLYADPASNATDAEQTLNVGERAVVRTCFGGPSVPCGSVQAGDPRIAGLRVLGELSGPELPEPLALETVPGGSFLLPGFQQEGEYFLDNVRLIGDGQVIALAEPSVAVLHVRQIVLGSATVRALSLAELRARGIELTQENFQAFDFAVGFAIQGETVQIEFPVLFEGNGRPTELSKPTIALDGLPAEIVRLISAWKPPTVLPIQLSPAPARAGLEIGAEETQELQFPLFGAIVIPGTVTFLNQFFEARLLVANGAPAGSGAQLSRLRSLARMPGNHALRLASTEPAVVAGQWLPVIAENGAQRLSPGGQGSATWVVEGLRAGTHALTFEIEGELERPGRDPLPVHSLAQAAVEVVDARFQLTFSHPDVVREDEEYTLFVTVTNLSQAVQNLITVDIREESMTGADPADPEDPLNRTIESLRPGESATVEFGLVSQITGKVIATTYQSDSPSYQGSIQLRTGVGELGIPLSPATLLMPRFTSELEQRDRQLVRTNVALLGLAHSLAVAPAALLPPGLGSLQRADVERRAVDLAEAGERLYLGDRLLESVEALAFDQLGNRHPLAGYDELRRKTNKGLRAAARLAARLREEQQARGLEAEELLDHLASTMSYARPYLAALLVPLTVEQPSLEAIDRLGGSGLLAGTADQEATAVRTLPWSEMYSLRALAGGDSPRASLALIGRLDGAATTTFLLRNRTGATTRSRLILLAPDGATGRFRRLSFAALTLEPGEILAIDAGAAVATPEQGGFRLYDPETSARRAEAAHSTLVPLPDFAIVGARQDFHLDYWIDQEGNRHQPNRYGNGVTYLFNRPPAGALAQQPEAFAIESTYQGRNSDGSTTTYASRKIGHAVFIQPNSERVAIVRYDGGISPLLEGGLPLVEHHHDIEEAAIRDQFGQRLGSSVPEPLIDTSPLHVGALVAGAVKRGTGLTVEDVKVELLRHRWFQKSNGEWILFVDLAATTTTDGAGQFFFDFHESPHQDRNIKSEFFLRASVPAGADPVTEPAEVAEVSFLARRQNEVAVVNIALLGRGGISGRLTYLDTGAPVAGGTVEAASVLFQEMKKVAVDGNGGFRFVGLPVGPISLAGRDGQGRRVYATVEIPAPGAMIEAPLQIQRLNTVPPGRGSVRGRVLFLRDGVEEEALGATVAVYSEGRFVGSQAVGAGGSFVFLDVPAGRVSLQAANFRVSRTAIATDLMLAAGEVREVELRIPASSPKRISGQVKERGPDGVLRDLPGAKVLLVGPGNLTHSGALGRYLLEDVPVQAQGENPYLQIVHPDHTREIRVTLPPIIQGEDEVIAETVVFESGAATGTVRGIVYDPLGRPVPYASVVLYPLVEGTAAADGTFVFENVPLSSYFLVGHVGDGLEPGKIGYIAKSESFGLTAQANDKFVALRMRGSGFVRIHTRTATSTGMLTPIYYRPTHYSSTAKDIGLRGAYIESTTDPNGHLELELPLGDFEVVAYNPFHGQKEISGSLTAAGQTADYEIVFESLGKVRGTVVANDGVTPIPFAEVQLSTSSLLPQSLQADENGRFLYELVPAGQVIVDARASIDNVDRVGRTLSSVRQGEEIEIEVAMLAQGSIRGVVQQETSPGQLGPVPLAQYYVRENSYPNRRLPEGEGNYYFADENGTYEVPHLFAGKVAIVARDSHDIRREGRVQATIDTDWSIVTAPPIVFRGADAVGRISFLVRDQQTGGPVADALVRLSTGEGSVSGADGKVTFEALKVQPAPPGARYFARAFYAPTGQAGQSSDVFLTAAGQDALAEIYLDQHGEVAGVLYDDPASPEPVLGATLRISGTSVAGRVEGLTTSSGQAGHLGEFVFSGIPEGTYDLTAASTETPRRASTIVTLTATSPKADLFLYLEQVGSRYFRIEEKLRAGNSPADLEGGVFSVKVVQGDPAFPAYSSTHLLSQPGTDLFLFTDLFLERPAKIEARELSGELRLLATSTRDFIHLSDLPGGGDSTDPYRLLLPPKGTVIATVLDAGGLVVAGANVRLSSSGSAYTRATGADGKATFLAVNPGAVRVSSASLDNVSSGSAAGTIQFDDDLIQLTIRYQPAVRAAGQVYSPPENDRPVADPSSLAPMAAARVELIDRAGVHHLTFADDQGLYFFEGLPTGSYSISATSPDGEQIAAAAGSLLGPDGKLNLLPALVLDGGPPKIVSISPPAGATGVSKTTPIVIVFSEPLASAFAPVGPASSHFSFRKSSGGAAVSGNWVSFEEEGRQVVRFVPSAPLGDFTLYTVTISGAVTDRAGRRLAQSGDFGSSFRTSDKSGPSIVATEPQLTRPLSPTASIRFDFNERVVATAEDLDGDGLADAALLEAQKTDGSWVALPAVYYLTRLNFSLQLDLPQGLSVPGDSLRRRLSVSRLRDETGNSMDVWQREFRLYDSNVPSLAVALPTADGTLYRSVTYTLAPVLGNLDDLPALAPRGDVDRVEYFFADPAGAGSAPGHVARIHPFAYTFEAAYFGTGQPRPFPVWVRAVDTSNNASPVVRLDLRVLPNAAPTIGEVHVTTAAGPFYSGHDFQVAVAGIGDQDSASLSLLVDFLRTDAVPPQRILQKSITLDRPAAGWAALAPPVLVFTKPSTQLPEGTPLIFRARVVDSSNVAATAESAPLAIADDDIEPRVSSIAIYSDSGSSPGLLFTIGDEIWIHFVPSDKESGLKSARVVFDRTDLFPQPLTVGNLYDGSTASSSRVRIPPSVSELTEVVATIEVEDFGGNTRRAPIVFQVQPAADPYAPNVHWASPFAGAQWPSGYSSVVPGAGVPLLLRVKAGDLSQGPGGDSVPGELFAVEIRGPEVAPDGSLRLSESWVAASRAQAPGSSAAGDEYELLWHIPNDLPAGSVLDFAVRAIDLGGSQIVETVQMTAVPARRVYQGVNAAVFADDPMLDFASEDPNGPVFFLDGTVLSLYPQAAGQLRSLPSLFIYSGGFISSGNLQRRTSQLRPVEINSLDSAVLYYPLELKVESFLGVAGGAAINGDGAGLLGGTLSRPIALPGIAGPLAAEPGFHGGMWPQPDLSSAAILRVYGDPRWPLLPGLGGRTGAVSSDLRAGGGPGGGAIRVEAATATVRIEGSVTARGLLQPRSTNSGTQSYGGAGGSIALRAAAIEGSGVIDASAERAGQYWLRGGGGRVALRYGGLAPDFDSRQVRAFGGGTVHLEEVPQGKASAPGRLIIAAEDDQTIQQAGVTALPGLGSGRVAAIDLSSARLTLDARPAALALAGARVVLEQSGEPIANWPIVGHSVVQGPDGPRVVLEVEAEEGALAAAAAALAAGPVDFHGVLRYSSIELAGPVKVLVRDDLALGPADSPSALANDPLYIGRSDESRLKLRGDRLSIAATSSVPEGDVLMLRPIEVGYTVADQLGVRLAKATWSDGFPAQEYSGGDKEVALETLRTFAAAGPQILSLRANGYDGSEAEEALQWNVLPNQGPAASLEPQTLSVNPGEQLGLRVVASDREGLAEVRLLIEAPWGTSELLVPAPGLPVTLDRTVDLPIPANSAAGSLRITARAIDHAGLEASSQATVAIAAGGMPTASWSASGDPQEVPAGAAIGFVLIASDADGNLKEARVTAAEGPVELFEPSLPARNLAGTDAEWYFSNARVAAHAVDGEEIVLRAEVEDHAGNVFQLAPLVFTVLGDHQAPIVDVGFPSGVTVGTALSGTIGASDLALDRLELVFDGEIVEQPAEPGRTYYELTTRPVAERPLPANLPLVIRAYDRSGNVATVEREIEILPDLPPAGGLWITSEVYDPSVERDVIVAGRRVTVNLSATDDVGLASGRVRVTGLVEQEESFELAGSPGAFSLDFVVPEVAQPGDSFEVSGSLTDSRGQTTVLEPQVGVVTLYGLVPPELRLYLDPENVEDSYLAGTTLQVVATGRKGFLESAGLSIELDGRTETGSGVAAGEWTLPEVEVPTVLQLRVHADGVGGLVKEITRPITVLPNGAPDAEIELLAPSGGATLPVGTVLDFHLKGRARSGIERIELYAGGSLAGTLAPAGLPEAYQGSLSIALPGQPGSIIYRAVVHTANGASAQTTAAVLAVAATTLGDPQEPVDWSSFEHQVIALGAGTWVIDEKLKAAGLILLPGAIIEHSPRSADPEAPRSKVELAVGGTLYLARGATVDTSGSGPADPANQLGGGHLGAGGLDSAGTGSAVYQPRKPGGGSGASRGGGVAWISAGRLVVDGEILSEGDGSAAQTGGGAGGSLWLRVAGELAGSGRISAEGAATLAQGYGSGGGGVVSLEYGSLAPDLRERISAKGGAGAHPGGAGAVLLKGPGDRFGRLLIEGGALPHPAVSGPLVGLPRQIPDLPAYEPDGNWLRIFVSNGFDPEDYIGGVVESGGKLFRVVDARLPLETGECPPEDPFCLCGSGGFCPESLVLRAAEASADEAADPLAPRAGVSGLIEFELRTLDGADVEPGSFDSRSYRSGLFAESVALRGQTLTGLSFFDAELLDIGGVSASLGSFGAETLFLRSGARLAAPSGTGGSGVAAEIHARKDIVLSRGAQIDGSAAGRLTSQGQYPAGAGHSHLGTGGGLAAPTASFFTYDNPFDPSEPGRGFIGSAAGGAAVGLQAEIVYLAPESALLVNGGAATSTGGSSGGSLRLAARVVAGDGRLEAMGGSSAMQHGGGGGGIAIRWEEGSGSWMEQSRACGGTGGMGKEAGGAGTVLLSQGSETSTSVLILDNCGRVGPLTYGIEPSSADSLILRGGARIVWPAVVETAGRLELSGPVTFENTRIEALSLEVSGGATLSLPAVAAGQPLVLRIGEELVVESGGRIDVSGDGLAAGYPGIASTAGNHLGFKGYSNPASRGTTYGSITRPAEPGTGITTRGGGVIDIEAANVTLAGATSGIAANGSGSSGGASGGSIWIRTGHLGGDGFIEARGTSGGAAGGGGAIAIEYDSAEEEVLQNVRAWGGVSSSLPGGAGTIFLFERPSATHGVLRLDNDGRAGATDLPSLGFGIAATGTEGASLFTSKSAIPSFFAGHWVEIVRGGAILGQWQVDSVAGNILHLAAEAGELDLQPGDSWLGVYDFDRLEVDLLVSYGTGDSLRAPRYEYPAPELAAGDSAIEAITPDLHLAGAPPAPPDPAAIAIEAAEIEGLYRVTVPASIFPAERLFSWIRLGDFSRSVTASWDAELGASFLWAGDPGSRLQLQAFDPRRPEAPLSVELPALGEGAESRGFGINLAAGERIVDLLSGERIAYLLLEQSGQLELLELELDDRAIRSLGRLPSRHSQHRLLLRHGAIGLAARGGLLPDAFFRLGEAGFEQDPAGLLEDVFARPAGAAGRFAPMASAEPSRINQ